MPSFELDVDEAEAIRQYVLSLSASLRQAQQLVEEHIEVGVEQRREVSAVRFFHQIRGYIAHTRDFLPANDRSTGINVFTSSGST